MTGPLVVVGDALLDVDIEGSVSRLCPDAPAPVLDAATEAARPGGAGLAALLAARDGHDVVLVTAVGADLAGERVRALLGPYLRVVALPDTGGTREKVRLRADGRSLIRLDRGGPPAPAPTAAGISALRAAVAAAGAVLVSDYAGGVAGLPEVRQVLADRPGTVPLVWDPHPRGAVPVPAATLVTPNHAEAAVLAAVLAAVPADGVGGTAPARSGDLAEAERLAATLVRRWRATAVAVTLGARGALLSYGDGAPLVVPAPAVPGTDSCGAGDRFAATAAGELARGRGLSEALRAAVRAAADFVAAGGAGAVVPSPGVAPPTVVPSCHAEAVAGRVRGRGGTVVATGGCFDILHAGHVATLRAARSLGDCLVVCLNSDASVRRLKGPGRPIVPQGDRARVLEALECVDAVVLFDEDTPQAVLARLRPDIWAKGGDYTEAALPEAGLVRSWGGQPAVLPYLDGRSTTRLVDRIGERISLP